MWIVTSSVNRLMCCIFLQIGKRKTSAAFALLLRMFWACMPFRHPPFQRWYSANEKFLVRVPSTSVPGWWWLEHDFFHSVGNGIIPIDELIFFRRGRYTTNQIEMSLREPWIFPNAAGGVRSPTLTYDAIVRLLRLVPLRLQRQELGVPRRIQRRFPEMDPSYHPNSLRNPHITRY